MCRRVPSTTTLRAQIAPNNYALAANSGTLMQSQHPFACSVSGLRPYACPHVGIHKSRKATPTPTNGSVLEAPQRELSPMPLHCTLIAVCPYTTNRFACSGKTPTVDWKQRRPRPYTPRQWMYTSACRAIRFAPGLSCEGVAPAQREGRVAGLGLAGERERRTKDSCTAAVVNRRFVL